MNRCLLLLVAALSMTAGPARVGAQSHGRGEVEERVALYTTAVSFEVAGRRVAVQTSMLPRGPVFAIGPVVDMLGGELEVGPLGQSHEIRLGETVFRFGPGSSAITVGQEINELSQAPYPSIAGLQVPLDLIETVYSELGGKRFVWLPDERRLLANSAGSDDLPVAVDVVHLQGVSTLVLQFPSRPRYRIEERFGRVSVKILGDRLVPPATLPTLEGGYLRDLRFSSQEITLMLAPSAGAESYELKDPYRLVFDVFPGAAPQGTVASSAPTPPRRTRIPTIVLDPGHGGSEAGAVSSDGLIEKEVTLRIARLLRSKLQARLPMRVILTRDEDADLPLETRSSIANQLKAEVFVSLHLNSSFGNTAHGAETYFLSLEASDERAQRAADEANRGARTGNPLTDLELILWDMAQSQHLAASQSLATLIQDELNQALGLRDRGVKQAPFSVLTGAAMPAVLVELGFLSNPDEVRKLQDPAYQNELAEALTRALVRYRSGTMQAAADGGGVPE